MMERKSQEEIREWVKYNMSDDDYLKFYALDSTVFMRYQIASKYLDSSRNDFFASLDDEFCDIEKAKDFHNFYKLVDTLMRIMAVEFKKELGEKGY